MPYLDLETARRHCQEMREVVLHRPGGCRDERALQRIQELSRAATSAVADRQCRDSAGALQDYACELYSEGGHEKWARGAIDGAACLRLEMLREIDALQARLGALQAHRDAVGRHRHQAA